MFLSFCVFNEFFHFSKKSGFGVFLVHPTVVSVLLSASVERCFDSRMQDFKIPFFIASWRTGFEDLNLNTWMIQQCLFLRLGTELKLVFLQEEPGLDCRWRLPTYLDLNPSPGAEKNDPGPRNVAPYRWCQIKPTLQSKIGQTGPRNPSNRKHLSRLVC